MKELPVISDYRQLLRDGIPLLDVRAPIEYSKGAFPNTTNIPLLNDEERHLIGIEYKHEGHEAAVDLGRTLIEGNTRQQRVDAWARHVAKHPHGALYCFRGGQRSRITQAWIHEATGIAYPRVEGGYKQLRRYLIEELERLPDQINPIVLGGRTGVGKTRLLKQLPAHLDLEGLARHRGSAFGHYATPQPTQIDFENTLAIALIRHVDSGATRLVVEDESRNIGSVHYPEALYQRFTASPLVILEATLDERVAITFDEYVTEALADFQRLHGDEAGFEAWQAYVLNAFSRIEKRLGGVRHQALLADINNAFTTHRNRNDATAHEQWIAHLLEEYYDPMYDYQLSRKQERIIFNGDLTAILEFLKNQYPATQSS